MESMRSVKSARLVSSLSELQFRTRCRRGKQHSVTVTNKDMISTRTGYTLRSDGMRAAALSQEGRAMNDL